MSTPRQTLAEQIAQDNPAWTVLPYPAVPGQVARGKAVCSVWRGDVNPTVPRSGLTHSVTVNVYGSSTGKAAEDDLDDYLDAVMLSIERVPGFKFESATRQTFANETLAGWQVSLTATSENVYRTEILKERNS